MAGNELKPSWHVLTHTCPCCNADCKIKELSYAATGQLNIVWECGKRCEKPDIEVIQPTQLSNMAHELDILAYYHSLTEPKIKKA